MHPKDIAFIDKYINLLCDDYNEYVFNLIKKEGK